MADTTLVDPLGRTIVLQERTWHGHIVKGHPEIKDDRRLVEWAVESPDEIRHSGSGPDCRIYYGPGPRPTVIMMVVADVALGIVKTAHLARKATGGAVEWSKPTP
jgi:hypothetical protein